MLKNYEIGKKEISLILENKNLIKNCKNTD